MKTCHFCEEESEHQLCGFNLCKWHQQISQQDMHLWSNSENIIELLYLDRIILVPSILMFL
jgi:hypothetical protein